MNGTQEEQQGRHRRTCVACGWSGPAQDALVDMRRGGAQLRCPECKEAL